MKNVSIPVCVVVRRSDLAVWLTAKEEGVCLWGW